MARYARRDERNCSLRWDVAEGISVSLEKRAYQGTSAGKYRLIVCICVDLQTRWNGIEESESNIHPTFQKPQLTMRHTFDPHEEI